MKIRRGINKYICKVTILKLYIFVKKVFKKVIRIMEDFYQYIKISKKGTYLTDLDFFREIGVQDKDDLLKENLLNNSLLNLIIDEKERIFITSGISSEEIDRIINFANDICEHKFNLLGSGKVKVLYELYPKGIENNSYNMNINKKELEEIKKELNNKICYMLNNSNNKKDLGSMLNIDYEPIDWHIDFRSGYRWDKKTWYKRIKYGHTPGVDIKVPWELSRFQYLITLGQAYVITEDEKYSLEYIYQITDWIENNPPQFGVTWVCTMDVAIRAASWILSLSFFKNSKLITNEFLFYFIKNIYIHGKHIINNLEYGSITSNHYLSDISGLLFISELFSEFDVGKKWKKFAINELKKEMAKQVYDDGVDFEASTCYHRLVLELFFYCTLFAIKNSPEFKEDNFMEVGENIFGKEYIEKLYKMFEFVLHILKPNGKMPQIGDNDNGRFFIFGNREILDMRYLLNFGAIFFKEPKFKVEEFGFCEETLWVFGKGGYKVWQELEGISLRNIDSKAFSDAGWYIMRSSKDYMIVSCGQNGQNGIGGHSHNDKLSFELCVRGGDVIVDTGTYVYTPIPEWRNKFRSTPFHNTIVVDGEEQNRFNHKSMFCLREDAFVKVNNWRATKEYDFLDAEHYGYRRLESPVIHRRQIYFCKKNRYWIIKDILTGEEVHTLDLYFHLAPGVIKKAGGGSLAVDIDIKGGENLKIIPLIKDDIKLAIEDGWLSYGYGEKVKSKVLKYSKRVTVPTEFLFVFALGDFTCSIEDIDKIIESTCQVKR